MKQVLYGFKTALGLMFLFIAAQIPAQELPPILRDQAVVLNITAKITENRQELLNVTNSKIAILGKPVMVTLEGGNVVIAIQFTTMPIAPKAKSKSHRLVTESAILLTTPNDEKKLRKTIKNIDLNLDEQIIFLPLGTDQATGDPHIELQIMLKRYEEAVKDGDSSETETIQVE
jgi:hypothetical protein